MRNDAAAELLALASAVARLRPDWRNGEAFYEARSEIIAVLRRLARTLVLPPPRPAPPRLAAIPLRTTPPRRILTPAHPPAPAIASLCPRRTPARRRHRYPRPPACAAQRTLFQEIA
jgi:hypothetical protein